LYREAGGGIARLLTDMGGISGHRGAMVERGDQSSIHVGSHRKAYQVRNDFLIFVVPEL